MRNSFPFFLLVSLIISCGQPHFIIDRDKEINEMMKTDLEFSGVSAASGMKTAFLQYLDSGAVLLRPGHYPMVGKGARMYLESQVDSSFSLTWEPLGADLSRGGDMGFTYGIYSLKIQGDSILKKGTYVSVWKKQADGKWKFVLDTGNPGLDEDK